MPDAQGRVTAAEAATLLALVEAHAQVRRQITTAAVAAAVAAWQSVGSWWRSDDTGEAIRRTLRVLLPSQRRLAQITDAYLARVLSVVAGRTFRPVGAVDVTRLRRSLEGELGAGLRAGRLPVPRVELPAGSTQPDREAPPAPLPRLPDGGTVRPEQVWGRIPDQYRHQVVTQGATEAQALRKALQRAEKTTLTDLALADRAQARRVLLLQQDQARIIGWRRILHPELSETGPCGLCVVAADRIYHVEDLLPLHPACVCNVLPVTTTADPGLNLNQDDLERVYAAAGGTAAAKLRQIRVAITEHGELGPILVDAEHKTRGPREAARTAAPDRPTRARAQLESLETTLDRLRAREKTGEDVSRPIAWQTRKVAELRAELGL